MKKIPFLIITGLVTVCIVFFAGIAIKNAVRLEKNACAQIAVTLTDGFSGEPIENARVVLAQTGQELFSGADGRAGAFSMPVKCDVHASLPRALRGGWDEATLLVYRDSYVDTVMFDVAAVQGQRRDVSISLFRCDDLPSQQVVVLSEAPEEQWLHELLEYFR